MARLAPSLAQNLHSDVLDPMQQSNEVPVPMNNIKTLLEGGVFSVEKAGNAPNENEDDGLINLDDKQGNVRIAIADGATESSFAQLWAKLLVKTATASEWSAETIRSDIAEACKLWADELHKIDLPWHAEVKVQQGDYATLLCLYIHQPAGPAYNGGTWNALCIGDCCLFHYRGEKLIASFPTMKPEEFGNRPLLINSIFGNNSSLWKELKVKSGEWQDGDEFILFTDAAAAWYLHEVEVKREPLQRINTIADLDSFRQFVIEQRTNGSLRNDDTTMIWLRVHIDSDNRENISD